MKMTYSEFVERYLDETADDPICENDNLLDWFDGVAALRKILTDVLPLIRDIEASATTVPTVEVDMGEEDDLPDVIEKADIPVPDRKPWARRVSNDFDQRAFDELVAKALVTGSAYYMQEWDTLTGKPRITAVDPYGEV